MAEYISKEQLLAHLFSRQDEPLDVMKEIASLTAADVAEVVRCRDCKNLCVGGVWFGDARWGCKILEVSVDLDFFCGFGERKEDEHEACGFGCAERRDQFWHIRRSHIYQGNSRPVY